MPLARRGDKQRQHAGMRIATGGGKRQVVMDTVSAKPNQMSGHKTPAISNIHGFDTPGAEETRSPRGKYQEIQI
jgi:hypothetical protein